MTYWRHSNTRFNSGWMFINLTAFHPIHNFRDSLGPPVGCEKNSLLRAKCFVFILSYRFTQFMMNILFAKTTHERFGDDLHKFHTFSAWCERWMCLHLFVHSYVRSNKFIERDCQQFRSLHVLFIIAYNIVSDRCCERQ